MTDEKKPRQLLLDWEILRKKKMEYDGLNQMLRDRYKGKNVEVGEFIITSKLIKVKPFDVDAHEYYRTTIRRKAHQ